VRTTATGGRVRECKIVAKDPDGTVWVMAGVLHHITPEHPYEIYTGEGASRQVVAIVPGPEMFKEHERQRADYKPVDPASSGMARMDVTRLVRDHSDLQSGDLS